MPFLPADDTAPADAIAGLLRQSWEFRNRDVAACNKLAAVAVALAKRSGTQAELGLSLAHLGNSERLKGDFREAGRRLESASSCAVADPQFGALVWEFWTSLYLDVRDFESAAVTALRAGALRNDDAGLCRSTTLLGLALGYGGDAIGAVKVLRTAVRLAADRDSLLIAIQPLIRFLLEAGRPDEALSVAQQGRPLVSDAPKLVRWRWSWHEALIHLHLGAPAAAAVTLGVLRMAYLGEGLMQEAAYVALDLAVALLRDQRVAEMLSVLRGVETVFAALGIEDCSRVAATLAAVGESTDPEATIRATIRALLDSQARPGVVRPAA